MQIFTSGDIAERIIRPGEKIEAALFRLQNWTTQNFIKTINEVQPGTGRRRLYDRDGMADAIVLETLTRGLSSPAVDLKNLLLQTRQFLTRPGVRDTFLIIALTVGLKPRTFQVYGANERNLAKRIRESVHETVVVLQVESLRAKLPREEG